jgi:hypothetical protein
MPVYSRILDVVSYTIYLLFLPVQHSRRPDAYEKEKLLFKLCWSWLTKAR